MLKLLVVDDEEFIQETMCSFFSSKGYQTYGASGGEDALSIIKKERPHLVLLDVMLTPGSLNGFEVLKKIKEIDKTIKVIIVTGKATDQQSMRRGEELGVNDYLLKPLDYEKLEKEALPKIGAQLFEDFRREADENRRLYKELNQGTIQTITALAKALDARDKYTFGHSERVSDYSAGIADVMGFSTEEIGILRMSSLLHDIGKIALPDEILMKPGKLTRDEFDEIKKHPKVGADILGSMPRLKKVVDIILHHHERYDGKGYPDGLKCKEIPEKSRGVSASNSFDKMASWILTVSDAYDAMTSPRPYRDALTRESAMEELMRCKGKQFNPVVVEAFQEYYEKNGEKFKSCELTVDYKNYPIMFIGDDIEGLEKIKRNLSKYFTIEIADSLREALNILEKDLNIYLTVIFQRVSNVINQEMIDEIIKSRFPITKIVLCDVEDIKGYDQVISKCQILKYMSNFSNPQPLKVDIIKGIEEAISKKYFV